MFIHFHHISTFTLDPEIHPNWSSFSSVRSLSLCILTLIIRSYIHPLWSSFSLVYSLSPCILTFTFVPHIHPRSSLSLSILSFTVDPYFSPLILTVTLSFHFPLFSLHTPSLIFPSYSPPVASYFYSFSLHILVLSSCIFTFLNSHFPFIVSPWIFTFLLRKHFHPRPKHPKHILHTTSSRCLGMMNKVTLGSQ